MAGRERGREGDGRSKLRTGVRHKSCCGTAACRIPWIMIFDWSWVIAIQFIINAVASSLHAPPSPPFANTLHPLPAQDIELWVPAVAKFPCVFTSLFLSLCLFASLILMLCEPFSTLLLNLLPIIFTFLFQFLCLLSLSLSHSLNCCFWLPSQLLSTFSLIFHWLFHIALCSFLWLTLCPVMWHLYGKLKQIWRQMCMG